MSAVRVVGVVGGELRQLGIGGLGTQRQAGTLASHGELVGIRSPVEEHRELASTGQRLAVVGQGRVIEKRIRARGVSVGVGGRFIGRFKGCHR